jgi:spore germination cell wall hydrolase CwlJ-like protein
VTVLRATVAVTAVARDRKRRRVALFGLGAFFCAMFPTQGGYQDFGALIARQPAVTKRWQRYLIASPFGTIHTTLDMPRPIGATIPRPPLYVLASVNPNEIAAAIGRELLSTSGALQYPSVNRRAKGDALAARPRAPLPPLAALPSPVVPLEAAGSLGDTDATRFEYNEYQLPDADDAAASAADIDLPVDVPPADLTKLQLGDGASGEARLYFGIDPLGSVQEALAPWAPGQAPVIASAQSDDADLKQPGRLTPGEAAAADKPGETVANKGQVTDDTKRPMSPSERLKLVGKSRARAEKCLANAVYFEARGESVRGQIAVAQVVMNRVFSPFYPKDVCSVVYQNAHRHLACQFTFACDGIPDVVTEPDAWARAKKIAVDVLDGKLWLPEIAKSTHYHAYWVHPSWVGEMRKLSKLGVHTFYRPRAWGDGSDEPKWSDPKTTAETAAKL